MTDKTRLNILQANSLQSEKIIGTTMKKTERATVYGRLPKDLVKSFKILAKKEVRTDNEMLRIALEELIKNHV